MVVSAGWRRERAVPLGRPFFVAVQSTSARLGSGNRAFRPAVECRRRSRRRGRAVAAPSSEADRAAPAIARDRPGVRADDRAYPCPSDRLAAPAGQHPVGPAARAARPLPRPDRRAPSWGRRGGGSGAGRTKLGVGGRSACGGAASGAEARGGLRHPRPATRAPLGRGGGAWDRAWLCSPDLGITPALARL